MLVLTIRWHILLEACISPMLRLLRYLFLPGFLADFAASFIYVPSEVLKTRLQLQGRFNNPFFQSGYNYRSTLDAARTIIRQEGVSALFYGYKATIFRDLPFSALQFAFYEQERTWAKQWVGSRDIGLGLEIATAASAGGLAGVVTCPLDVVKTRVQTQSQPLSTNATRTGSTGADSRPRQNGTHRTPQPLAASAQRRHISTSSPSTTMRQPGAAKLDTSSVLMGLRMIYKTEGVVGLFRGVGPRAVLDQRPKWDHAGIISDVVCNEWRNMGGVEMKDRSQDEWLRPT